MEKLNHFFMGILLICNLAYLLYLFVSYLPEPQDKNSDGSEQLELF